MSKGAFIQQKNKTWCIDTKVKINGQFLHLYKSGYPTLASAKADFENVKSRFIQEKSIHYETLFFEDLIKEYIEYRKQKVNESTLMCDNSIYNRYFYPYWKKKLIKDVFIQDVIKEWYHNLTSSSKYSKNKQSKVITLFKDLLNFAYLHRYISPETKQDIDIVVYQVRGAKANQKQKTLWTTMEKRNFIQATEIDKKDNIMFKVFLTCSPRISEFLGLQVNCFDRAKKKITIKQQFKYVQGKGSYICDELKSHDSYRSIIIPESLSKELCDYIDTLGLKNDEFLWFLNDNRKVPMSKQSFRRKLYYYCDVADVPHITPHTARHMQAVDLARHCNSGEDIEIAASILGHTVSVFLNTYANHRNEEKQASMLESVYKA